MSAIRNVGFAVATCLIGFSAAAAPTVGSTTVLGTIAGPGAQVHPDNLSPQRIEFYGTDLGWTYTHSNKIHFLFGDTWRTGNNAPIEPPNGVHDDAFGTVDLLTYNAPQNFSPTAMPLIKLAQAAGSVNALALNPNHAMDIGKTPLGGFSNGTNEYALFTTTKPLGCRTDNECATASAGLTCDTTLGYFNTPYTTQTGITGGCADSQFGCTANTMSGTTPSGFCVDKTSTSFGTSASGRVSSAAMKLLIGARSTTDARNYTGVKQWMTAKFLNSSLATVQSFVPANGSANQDYNIAGATGSARRVFLWGRSAFVGVNAAGRTAGLYFAYVDMPTSSSFNWNINYFTRVSNGVPQFSTNQADAAPLDLDATTAAIDKTEKYDVVNQMSVIWVQQLGKWVMFYGGGMSNLVKIPFLSCGVLEVFTGPDCTRVALDNGAIRMRTADNPWGPWSTPVDVIVGGKPGATPLQGEYRPGGVLRHPRCSPPSNCAPHSPAEAYLSNEYGFLYGANLVQSWVRSVPGSNSVDVIWNASTWDPYRVVLLRTRINP